MSDTIQIVVDTGSSKRITITIRKDATVEELMEKVSEWTGRDPEHQRLIHAGNELELTKRDKKMHLPDYNILHRAVMHCVTRMAGGAGGSN